MMTSKQLKRLNHKFLSLKKSFLQLLAGKTDSEKKVILIVGCQRSGTSIMSEIFDYDVRTKIFGEMSRLSSPHDPKKLRLLQLPEVKKIIDGQIASIVILKPLVESQHITELLHFFKNSQAIWMYRHYKDVVASNLIKFGKDTGVRDLRPIVNQDQQNWRSENITQETRDIVLKYFSEDMAYEDAAALFWYIRNRIFFEQILGDSTKVMLCQYDDLVQQPVSVVKKMYNFLQIQFPEDNICETIHSSSVKKGKSVELSPEIEELCEDMYVKLNEVYFENSKSSIT